MAAAEPEPGWQHRGGPIGTPLWLWGRRCLRALGSFAPNPIRLAARAARGKVLSAGSCGGSAARSSLPASLGAGGALSPARCPQAASRLLFFRGFFLLFSPQNSAYFLSSPAFLRQRRGCCGCGAPRLPRGQWGHGGGGSGAGRESLFFGIEGAQNSPLLGNIAPGDGGALRRCLPSPPQRDAGCCRSSSGAERSASLPPQASTPRRGSCSGTGRGGPCGCWRALNGSAPPRPCGAASARAAWAARGTRSSGGTARRCAAPRSGAGAACGIPSTTPRTSCSCRATASSM